MKASRIHPRLSHLTHFILLGGLLELLYLLLFALIPVFMFPPTLIQSGPEWPWILAPAQLLAHKISNRGINSTLPGSNYLILSFIIIALASIYLYAVVHAFHSSNNELFTSRWLLLPVVGATIFGITLLFLPALFHEEAKSYIMKSVALLSHIINCVLIWAFLGKLAPSRRLGGTILYAWNPLALIELAGNGRNEGFLICFLLLTPWLIVQQKGLRYDFLAMILLGIAISINFIALLFAPILLWFSVRYKAELVSLGQQSVVIEEGITTKPLSLSGKKDHYPVLVWGFCWRAIVASAIVLALYLPFWQGSSTFLAITSSFNMQQFIHSPLGILAIPDRWLFSLIVQLSNIPATISSSYLHPIIAADFTVRASAMFIFTLIYFYLIGKVQSIDTLLTSLCLASLGFIVLISGQFWPWYILWVLWIVTLRRFDVLTVSVLLLSSTALLLYPLLILDNLPIAILQPLLIFGIPLIYVMIQVKRSSERRTIFNDRRSETTQN